MNLFELIKVMFTDPKKYNELKNNDKSKNHFMVNRFMSINFPHQANLLNRNGINGIGVIDTWQFVTSRFKKVPGWIYTKTKKTKLQKEREIKIDENLMKIYLEVNQISKKDFDLIVKLYPKEIEKYFKKLKLQYDTYDRI